ncbi:DUF4394 domain-containing protein [Leptolyngbya sp. FACHB-261]|uniref:DUF4394 domain-containing protein n=1 Tax=Leptolyngbya sp. FACHB-261 TaxID=2692806 RepID=UPI0016831D60|nr:DUF4394 domain-containing protein [Leptolyngbya sp. FACHB-261]MBD2102490.1 DUF4394 domain-containing protein [Leptolyngbya sp. FACHB-261]
MRLNRFNTIAVLFVATALTLLKDVPAAQAATTRLFGLTESNTLLSFDPNDPAETRRLSVTGINGTLLGIDFRSANGLLYGVTDKNGIYTIDLVTGAATLQNSLSPLGFTSGQQSGLDFNPAADRLRLVGSNDQNFRINVDTGVVADFDLNTVGVQPDASLAYAPGDVNAGVDPNITAAAYTNAFRGAPAGRTTQLYGIDFAQDVLVLQNPPNAGTLNTVGSLGVDFGALGGFDIFSPSKGINTAFAASGSTLYKIDLPTGKATAQGTIGRGDTPLIGLAATSVPEPATLSSLIGLGIVGLLSRRRRSAQ